MKAYKHRCQSLEKQLERMKENQSNMFDKVMKKNMAALEAMVHARHHHHHLLLQLILSSHPTGL